MHNLSPNEVESLRCHFRLSFADLAELTGIPLGTIKDYVYGRCTFERRPEHHAKISSAFERLVAEVPVGLTIVDYIGLGETQT